MERRTAGSFAAGQKGTQDKGRVIPVTGKTMCIFIAGIQPKTVTLEDHARMCQACGLYQARLKRIDHYFSLFFLRRRFSFSLPFSFSFPFSGSKRGKPLWSVKAAAACQTNRAVCAIMSRGLQPAHARAAVLPRPLIFGSARHVEGDLRGERRSEPHWQEKILS